MDETWAACERNFGVDRLEIGKKAFLKPQLGLKSFWGYVIKQTFKCHTSLKVPGQGLYNGPNLGLLFYVS